MKKPIFENEEECVRFAQDCIPHIDTYGDANKALLLVNAKSQGYIKKSALAEAREFYTCIGGYHRVDWADVITLRDLYEEAIKELKNEN